MQVFKAFFKVIKKNLLSMLIYFGIFIFIAAFLANSESKNIENFTETKSRIAIINYDGDSSLVESLTNYLEQHAIIVKLKEDKESMQDALFYRDVMYILTIPQGFTQNFMNGDFSNSFLEKITIPESISGIYVDSLVNQYLNIAKLYIENMPNITDKELAGYINKDLKLTTEVKLNSYHNGTENKNVKNYFIYLSYAVMAIIILGVTANMMVFNQVDLKRRNLCTPLKPLSLNMQLILGCLIFALAVCILSLVMTIPIYGLQVFNLNFILWSINLLVFAAVCLSIGYFVSLFIKSRSVQGAVANVLSLGLCFISGVFVPQEVLGKTVLNIASFTPTYWYVKGVNLIKDFSNFDWEKITTIAYSMLIQLGFGLAMLALALAVGKSKRLN